MMIKMPLMIIIVMMMMMIKIPHISNFYKCLPSNGINSINLQSIFNSRTNSMNFIISSSLNPRIKTKQFIDIDDDENNDHGDDDE